MSDYRNEFLEGCRRKPVDDPGGGGSGAGGRCDHKAPE